MSRHARAAFTLTELLVGAALGVLTLIIATVFFSTTQRASLQATHGANQYRDLQSAASVIADDLRQAAFIYPSGVGVNLDATEAPGAPTATGTALLAMIVPPEAGSPCGTEFEFVAHYAAQRTAFSASGDWTRLPDDPANAHTLALATYRACADRADLTAKLSSPRLRLLAEHLGLVSFGTSGLDATAPNSATITLRGERSIGGRTVYVPSASDSVRLQVLARNIGGQSSP